MSIGNKDFVFNVDDDVLIPVSAYDRNEDTRITIVDPDPVVATPVVDLALGIVFGLLLLIVIVVALVVVIYCYQ